MHTDVGNMAVGCKINGKIAPLVSELTNGDEVEIITSQAQIAAGGVGIARHDEQGPRRHPPHAPRCAASMPASVDASWSGSASVPVRLFRRKAARRAAAAGARLGRRGDVRGRPRRDARAPTSHGRCIPTTRKSVPPSPSSPSRRAAGSASKSHLGEGAGSGRDRCGDPIRGINTDLPVRFAPNGGAVPGDRIVGILRPARHHHLSDPVAGAEGLRGRARALARSALGRRGAHAAALSGAHRAADGERAGLARPGRRGDRRGDGNIDNISMERSSPDFTSVTIDLEVFDIKHLNRSSRAIASEGRGGECGAGERVKKWISSQSR